jgi:hypothetical protein
MTTFQDPPPQSRRAVRQSERGETPAEGTPTVPTQSAPYSFDAPPEPVQQTPAAPTAPQSGRRAQTRVAPPADAQTSQPLANQPPPGAPGAHMPGESAEQAAYRMRDFSPEGRRSASQLPTPSATFAPPARPVELDYQTQGVAPGASHIAASTPLDDTLNHTLSRRELREMRAAAEAQAPALQPPPTSLPEPIDTLLNSGPIEIPTLAPPPGQSQALAEAMAEFDLLTRSRREAEARARDAQVASLATPIIAQAQVPIPAPQEVTPLPTLPTSVPQPPAQQLPFAQQSVPQPDPYSAPQASAPLPPVSDQSIAYPPTASLPSPQAPISSVPVSSAPVASVPSVASVEQPPSLAAPVFSDQPVAAPPPAPSSSVQSAPTDEQDQHGGRSPRASGHWRVQAAIEDNELPYENTLSRTVGSNTSAITTSALVLPSVPQPDRILNNLTSTGEILVTGTIDLPSSLGSTGAHPSRIDNSDYEDDPLDSQVAAPDSAPIRAIRAVSTNTSTRGVIETRKPKGTRVLTAVIIVASVLCVGLVGLLVFAFATNKL